MSKYYITTTLPYVNAEPHIGFAMEIVRADCLARWRRLKGDTVFFNTGVDEHGLKIFKQATEAKITPQEYCDQMAAKFADLKDGLDLSYDNFVRTTDDRHIKAAQEFWRRSSNNGDIYKKAYRVKYCVGCELTKTESELVNGRCPLHPQNELELIDEENYFFRFSKYADRLTELYAANPEFVVPAGRLKEISAFVQNGLEDFSVSRLKSKMPWGVPVPGDDSQVMYVWFDALINYISCLDWPDDVSRFTSFWPGIQVAGKDNLRQQAVMWQAMLMSVGLSVSKRVYINGFITANGQKMSKSLGNVINPLELTAKYGSDATRYFLLGHLSSFEDSDYTDEKFLGAYTADLANGLGNLLGRVTALYEKHKLKFAPAALPDGELSARIDEKLNRYQFAEALKELWTVLKRDDEKLSAETPWKLSDPEAVRVSIEPVAKDLLSVGYLLKPFMPQTAEKIISRLTAEKITKAAGLFPRL